MDINDKIEEIKELVCANLTEKDLELWGESNPVQCKNNTKRKIEKKSRQYTPYSSKKTIKSIKSIDGTFYKNAKNYKNFTDNYIKLVDELVENWKVKNPDPSDKFYSMESDILQPITNVTKAMSMSTAWSYSYTPDNYLYFYFLCNLYCNSKKYVKYDWLPRLLFVFEQLSLTGEFKINEYLYTKLFADCSENIQSNLPFAMERNEHYKIALYDLEHKSLCNSSISQVLNTSDEDTIIEWNTIEADTENQKLIEEQNRAGTIKPPCKYGTECYRLNNPKHRHEFSHPIGETDAGGGKTYKSITKKRSITNKRSKSNKRKQI